MKFKATYIIRSIPSNDIINKEQSFSFTYETELSQIGDLAYHVNEFLRKRFNEENYCITGIQRMEE
jgi:hypothetical protein